MFAHNYNIKCHQFVIHLLSCYLHFVMNILPNTSWTVIAVSLIIVIISNCVLSSVIKVSMLYIIDVLDTNVLSYGAVLIKFYFIFMTCIPMCVLTRNTDLKSICCRISAMKKLQEHYDLEYVDIVPLQLEARTPWVAFCICYTQT